MKFERAETDAAGQAALFLEDYRRRPGFYRETFHVEDEAHMERMVTLAVYGCETYLSEDGRYQVAVYREVEIPGWPPMVHLSIKRTDREPLHDWRVLQEIKNALVGPECEGVELYPAESRLVDTANQYHLFCLPDASRRFPFGFVARSVTEDEFAKSKQRPFARTTCGGNT